MPYFLLDPRAHPEGLECEECRETITEAAPYTYEPLGVGERGEIVVQLRCSVCAVAALKTERR